MLTHMLTHAFDTTITYTHKLHFQFYTFALIYILSVLLETEHPQALRNICGACRP